MWLTSGKHSAHSAISSLFLICLVSILAPCDAQITNRYRLSGSSRPQHYNLQMKIDVDEQLFTGSVDITLEVLQRTTVLDLHYKDMEIANVHLTDNNVVFALVEQNYSEETEILSLEFPELPIGSYKLSMDFSSKIRTDLKGLYMSTYFDDNGDKRFIATTFMAPTYARMAFPCFDEPEYKANYTIHITHADKYFALSNMPAEDLQTDLGNGWKTTHFKETKPTSTYIVAFIVCDFVNISNPNWPLSIYSQPAVIKNTEYALSHFDAVRAELESYLGRSFQYPKLDMIAIDDFLMGAMENWGLITYLSSRILINDSTDIKTKISGSKTMSHEMAHQWFGNEVTHHYWNVVWLKEGLATLFEDLLTDAVHPDWRMWDQFVINTMQVVMQQDCAFNVRHMMKDYTTPAEIRAVYDFVTYKKAGSVMRMMMNVLTAPVFKLAMDHYIEDNSYATSTNVKLAAAWQKAVDASGMSLPDIATVFEHWTNVPGFPVITVMRTDNKIRVHQQRFISSYSRSGSEIVEYHIPLNYATQKNPDFINTAPTMWLIEREASFELTPGEVESNQWLIFNKQATGYYRVNYDNANWALISNALKENHALIAPANRAQILDDALNLARYGHLDYQVALTLVDYVKKEEDFAPLTSVFANLKELERVARGGHLNLEDHYIDLVKDLHSKHGLGDIPSTESDVDRLARIEIVNFACKYSLLDCTLPAFNILTANQITELSADFRPAIFCGAVRYQFSVSDDMYANVVLYNRLPLRASTEGDRRKNDKEVNDIFNAFSCVQNEIVLEEVLGWTISGLDGVHFDKGDPNKIYSAVASANITGTKIALQFLTNHYKEIEEKFESMPKVFEALSLNVVTTELKEIYDKIIETHVVPEKISDAFKTALDTANVLIIENLKWKELRIDAVKEFLRGSAVNIIVSPVLLCVMMVTIVLKSIL